MWCWQAMQSAVSARQQATGCSVGHPAVVGRWTQKSSTVVFMEQAKHFALYARQQGVTGTTGSGVAGTTSRGHPAMVSVLLAQNSGMVWPNWQAKHCAVNARQQATGCSDGHPGVEPFSVQYSAMVMWCWQAMQSAVSARQQATGCSVGHPAVVGRWTQKSSTVVFMEQAKPSALYARQQGVTGTTSRAHPGVVGRWTQK